MKVSEFLNNDDIPSFLLSAFYDKSEKKQKEVKEKFIYEHDKYNHLKEIHDWWNTLKMSFDITSIGRTLGHANAQYCYPKFPPLD